MNHEDIPWVTLIWQAHYQGNKLPQARNLCGSFWWKDCLSLWKKFEELTSIKASNGRTVRIWKDKWIEPKAMEEYPHLFSFARDQDICLEKFHAQSEDNVYDLFHCPLSLIAAEECDSLVQNLQQWSNNNEDLQNKDQWTFQWAGKYSCKKVYEQLDDSETAPPPFQWIWKSRALPKQRFFFWLLYWID